MPSAPASTVSFIDSAVISRLLALPLNARQAMTGSVSGRHRSPVRGSSVEFAQYRKYVPGDDTRPPAEDTTLVVNFLRFVGSGWHTAGDALLANTAAAMARERRRIGREEAERD